MARPSLDDIADTEHNEEILWINDSRGCGIPVVSPFEETISEDTIIIFSICNYVENSGSKCPILSSNPPDFESGEPSPFVDYIKLSRIIKSNRDRITPDDIVVFQELAHCRRAYFTAYNLFFKSDNTLRDLFAERCQLFKTSQIVVKNPDKFTIESRRDISERVGINVRNCAAEKKMHAIWLRDIAACTARLAGIKHKAASILRGIWDKSSKSQRQRKKTSNGMATGIRTHNMGGSGALKTRSPSPMPRSVKLITSNGISKGRPYNLQPAGLAVGNKMNSVDELKEGFKCNVPQPYHTPVPSLPILTPALLIFGKD
ncbi:predicted protein [Histoplasma capsulatum G186AR]|uniref:Uncharacterized protein n=2 Tax=Ajellomyces capsulatus TaxID=5037 RepID=C0NSU1_AJECG|nr:uncharacterized protein HCBG_06221 [Histoplasma capsulatum G186AR]EEH05957.1 predicted protein [Histoplasma capsulatum G186AR]